MNTQFYRKNSLLAFGAAVLAGAALAASPVRAQDAGTATPADNGKPISLNLINVPVQTALRTLFSSAGIRNYSIDPGVQGYANINVSDVPFSLALRQLLSSGNPPLTFSFIDGVYQVKVQTAVAPPATTIASAATTDTTATDANAPKRFYPPIPVNSYDAFYIAQLVGQTGIIEVLPNYPADSGGGGTQGGAQGNRGSQGFGGQRGGGGGGFGGGLTNSVSTAGGGGFSGSLGGGFRGY